MATEVLVPTLGDSITEATLGEWLKQPGDAVELDDVRTLASTLADGSVSVSAVGPIDETVFDDVAVVR